MPLLVFLDQRFHWVKLVFNCVLNSLHEVNSIFTEYQILSGLSPINHCKCRSCYAPPSAEVNRFFTLLNQCFSLSVTGEVQQSQSLQQMFNRCLQHANAIFYWLLKLMDDASSKYLVGSWFQLISNFYMIWQHLIIKKIIRVIHIAYGLQHFPTERSVPCLYGIRKVYNLAINSGWRSVYDWDIFIKWHSTPQGSFAKNLGWPARPEKSLPMILTILGINIGYTDNRDEAWLRSRHRLTTLCCIKFLIGAVTFIAVMA